MAAELDRDLVPFSPEWFATARELLRDVAIAQDRSCRVQFDVSGTRWFLTVSEGRIEQFELGDCDEPEVEIRWGTGDAQRIVARELRGNDALLATTVVARAAGDTYVGPPAPLNLACRPELASVPIVQGATFATQYHYRHGPFGAVDYVLRFEDGRVAEERIGRLNGAEVTVDVTYRAMARVRAGEITIIEALEGGSVNGDIGPMGALAGISETDEFHAAELATGRHALALAVLGELDSDPTFAGAMEHLASRSRPI